MAKTPVLAALVLGATVAAKAVPGYLTLVGPGPLRFQASADPFAGMAALPPLLMCDPVPETATNATPQATNAPSSNSGVVPSPTASAAPVTVPPAVAPTNAPPASVPAGTNAVAAPTNSVQGVVGGTETGNLLTPQMLLQYFRKPAGGTNASGGETSVVVPLFTPPQPMATPASRSTYSSP